MNTESQCVQEVLMDGEEGEFAADTNGEIADENDDRTVQLFSTAQNVVRERKMKRKMTIEEDDLISEVEIISNSTMIKHQTYKFKQQNPTTKEGNKTYICNVVP